MKKDSVIIAVLFAAGFLLSVLPVIVRWHVYGIEGIIGFPTYFHQRIAEDIVSGRFSWWDSLSFGGRPYTYPPAFAFSIAAFGVLFGVVWGGVVFMAMLGGFASVLVWKIAGKLGVSGGWSSVAFVLSPMFAYLFSSLSSRSPPIVLGMLSLYMVLDRRDWRLSLLPLALAFPYHWEAALFFLLVSSVAVFWTGNEKRTAVGFALAGLLLGAAAYAPLVAAHGLPEYNLLHEEYMERGYGMESFGILGNVWEIGYWNGKLDCIYAVVFVLAVAGFALSGSRILRFWFALALLLSFLSDRMFVYVFPVSALLAASVLEKARITHRESRIRKGLMIVFLAYLSFSTAVAFSAFASEWPSNGQIQAFKWLKENTPENAAVLSDWTMGHWVTGIAHRKSFVDGYAEYAPEVDERMEALERFYGTCEVPEGYGIGYIVLEKWFIERRNITCIWDFPLVYNNSGVYIFRASLT